MCCKDLRNSVLRCEIWHQIYGSCKCFEILQILYQKALFIKFLQYFLPGPYKILVFFISWPKLGAVIVVLQETVGEVVGEGHLIPTMVWLSSFYGRARYFLIIGLVLKRLFAARKVLGTFLRRNSAYTRHINQVVFCLTVSHCRVVARLVFLNAIVQIIWCWFICCLIQGWGVPDFWNINFETNSFDLAILRLLSIVSASLRHVIRSCPRINTWDSSPRWLLLRSVGEAAHLVVDIRSRIRLACALWLLAAFSSGESWFRINAIPYGQIPRSAGLWWGRLAWRSPSLAV